MTDPEITVLDPDESQFRTMLSELPHGDRATKHEWLTTETVAVSDCPLCIVCQGRRVWHGFRCWYGWKSCLVCGGHGRMPFIYP